jgi:radical SAM superfamily enzyme YgiQ (UPF0313 family)
MSLPEKSGYINYIPFPFFLAYAAALLKSAGKETKLVDAIAEDIREEAYIDKAVSYKPDLLIAEVSTPSLKEDLRIIERIKKTIPDCKIALSGPHASIFPKQIMNEHFFVDFVLIGEYELTALELAGYLEQNNSLGGINGLVWRKGQDVQVNDKRGTLDNLDSLPWPERKDVPIYKYNDAFAGLPAPNVQLWSSRGCPFKCIFCLWPQTMYGDNRYRLRNAEDVVNEMEWLINHYGFKAVYFDDDVFNINRQHVLDICKWIKIKQIKTPWAAMARVDFMDEELLRVMQGSGLCAIKYGIESGSRRILDSCRIYLSV